MNLIKVNIRNKKRLLLPALNSLQLSQVTQKTHKDVANRYKTGNLVEMIFALKIKLKTRKDQNGFVKS